MFNFKLHSFSLGNFILQHQNINFYCCPVKVLQDKKNKAETLLQDSSLFCYFACCKKTLVT